MVLVLEQVWSLIGAVIFADGTHFGRTINPDYYNKEAVAQIFELRAGLAAGWNQWAAKINAMSNTDDNTVVQQFFGGSRCNA